MPALRGIEPFYQTDVVHELTLKGKRLSVPVYHIHSQSKVRTRFEASTQRGLTALVGRERELSQLQAAIDSAAEGGGVKVLALTGSAGMGKTRVLEELARRYASTDVHVYRGTCDSYGSVVPLQPLEAGASYAPHGDLPAQHKAHLQLGSKARVVAENVVALGQNHAARPQPPEPQDQLEQESRR